MSSSTPDKQVWQHIEGTDMVQINGPVILNPSSEPNPAKERGIDFLKKGRALPVTTGLYALWLYAYTEGGGIVSRTFSNNFTTMEMPYHTLSLDKNMTTDEVAGWDNPYANPFVMWTPTVSPGVRIPAGYGANRMDLLIVPQIAEVSLEPSTNDNREGWEWGHSEVRRLWMEGGRAVAATNQPGDVVSYADVEAILDIAKDSRIKPHDMFDETMAKFIGQ